MSNPVVAQHPLAQCFELLSKMGDNGRIIWELNKLYASRRKNPLGDAERVEYMLEAIRFQKKQLEIGAAFERKYGEPMWITPPLDFRTFVDSVELMNKNGVLWPEVLREGAEINSGKYVEVVLTGGIGVAKSTLALYTQAYQTYILSRMANPHEVFDLDPSSEIMIVFQSINKNVAKDVDYTRFRDMISGSPYFMLKFPFDKDRESDMRFPKRIIVKPVSGSDTGAIGQNVIGGILDEINFMQVVEDSKQSATGGLYDQATQNYNSIASRRESRFLVMGSLPGMLCLVSSRNYPGQFTDKKEAEAKVNPRIYVYDKRIWDLRPERFCGEWFNVFIGDATRKPRILLPGETVPKHEAHLVVEIPVEFKQAFDNDLLVALREKAGVSTQAMHPFIADTDAITRAFGRCKSVLSREDCDFSGTILQVYPRRFEDLHIPRFVHLDPSKSRDSFGVAVGYVPKFVEVDRGDTVETLPVFKYDLLLEIRPPRGGEIQVSNIRRLLYRLRSAGMLLKWLSSDTFQSMDNLQILQREGFIVGHASLDEDTEGYDILKQAIYDDRVIAPTHPKAQHELATLEISPKDGKIDHPPKGSKDVSDAMAGVAKGLLKRREVWSMHGVSPYSRPRVKPPETANKPVQADSQAGYMNTLRRSRG